MWISINKFYITRSIVQGITRFLNLFIYWIKEIIMFSMVYITAGSVDEAKQIAQTLVEMKYAACVNIFPITSIYRWDGVHEDDEIAMIVKTTYEQIEKIVKTVKEMHSYTVPCVLSFSIDGGSREYLDWIDNNVLPVGTIRND